MTFRAPPCMLTPLYSQWCHWIFQLHIFFRPHRGPGVDSAPSENEYQEHFLGVKVADAWGRRPPHLHMLNVMEIWEPKPLGALWATPGLLRGLLLTLFILLHYCTLQRSRGHPQGVLIHFVSRFCKIHVQMYQVKELCVVWQFLCFCDFSRQNLTASCL